jgi:hypothetical protein
MTPDQIEGWTRFLEYGPIGLAALMLVLVIVALLIGNFSAGRERTIRLFMYIGAGCFAIAVVAAFVQSPQQFQVFFRVLPIETEESSLPRPLITVNNKPLEEEGTAIVDREMTVIIDVSRAMAVARAIQDVADQQKNALVIANTGLDQAMQVTGDILKSPTVDDSVRVDVNNVRESLSEAQDTVSRTLSIKVQ